MRERVAIIGGGPAGCSAALRCSELGLRVVLFEAGNLYRDKPCGDALLNSAVGHARAFGLSDTDFRHLGGRPFERIDLLFPTHSFATQRQLESGGWVIPRASLDQALRDAISAKCDVRYGTFVRSVLPTTSGVSVAFSKSHCTSEVFGAVILAAGASSKLSRLLRIDGEPLKGVAVRGYVPDIHRPDSLLFEVTGTQPIQYKWQFPLTDRANVGACQMNKCRDLATELRMLVRRYGVTKLAGGVEPLWSGIGTKWHHPGGIVSCGDSAGLINPITGEGITAAFISGEMAAQAISDYLGSKGAVSLVNFSSQMWEVFSAKYKMSTSKDLLSTLRALDSEG